MIFPSINDLTKDKYDKYTLVIATAKCAREITDEYVIQREYAERKIANKETDKSIAALIKKEYRDEFIRVFNRDGILKELGNGNVMTFHYLASRNGQKPMR